MKYLITIYYHTPVMDKVTSYMRQIMDDWKHNKKELLAKQTVEVATGRPLTVEEVQKIIDNPPEWAERIEVEGPVA